MERKWNSRNSNRELMRLTILNLLFSLMLASTVVFESYSQTVSKLKEFKAKGITGLTVDRLGNFFLTFKNGMIRKYDSNGKLEASLKNKMGLPTLVEPWFHPSIFVYYRKSQKWVVYDREFKNPQVNQLDPSVAINPYLVCPTNDNKLLVLDKSDCSIKKVNRFTNELMLEFSIDTTKFSKPLDLVFLREYQNMIFLLNRNSGILIFNSIGKLINQIEKQGLQNFGFYGEELFYIEGNKTMLFDLYTEKTREIPLENAFGQLCITDERIIGIDNYSKVEISKFIDTYKE